MLHRPFAALALLLVMLLIAACGGAASPSPAATGTPVAPASQPPASEPASEPPTEEPTAGASGSPDIDLGGAAEALENIDSYRIEMVIEGDAPATFSAVIVREPEPAQEITIESAGNRQRIIVIGGEAWMDAGTGEYTAVPAEIAGGLASAFDPVALASGLNQETPPGALVEVGVEDRNGVQATHYRLDPSAPGLESIPPGAEMDIWIAEDGGYLVGLEATGLADSVTALTMNISDVNSPQNVVQAPD
jgi:hypothetical protein